MMVVYSYYHYNVRGRENAYIYIYVSFIALLAIMLAGCSLGSGSALSSGATAKGTQTVGMAGLGSEPAPAPANASGGIPPVDPFELAEWDIVTFVDPRDSSIYEIIDGRVIIALKNPPSLPEVDPNYFDVERDSTDPVYSQVVYYYTMTQNLNGLQTMVTDTALAAFLAAENVTVCSEWPEVGGIAVTLPEGQTVADAVANWPTEYPTLIEAVDPDSILNSCVFPYTQPNDESLSAEWFLRTYEISYPGLSPQQYSANVFSVWRQGQLGHPSRVVAVLDTGVCSQNTDLIPASTLYGVNTGDKRNSTEIKQRSLGGGEPWPWLMERSQAYAGGLGHGTLVTGVISAAPDNDTANTYLVNDIAGIAPGCKYLPVAIKSKGIATNPGFSARWSMSAFLNALNAIGAIKGLPGYRAASPCGSTAIPYYDIEVVNMSLSIKGSGAVVGDWHLGYLGKYILCIASAGNEDTESYNVWPACHPQVMAVAAHNSSGSKWSDSNYQPYVEISAPGYEIWTTDMKGYTSNGYYRGKNDTEAYQAAGTSLSAPVVSGAALFVISKWPSLWPSMVRAHLVNTAGVLPDPDLDHMGHVDVYGAMNP